MAVVIHYPGLSQAFPLHAHFSVVETFLLHLKHMMGKAWDQG